MASKSPSVTIEPGTGAMRPDWRWMFANGALAMALGLLGLALTPFLTISAVLVLGAVLAGASLYQLAMAVRGSDRKLRIQRLGYAAAYAFGGVAMLLSPAAAAAALTLVLAGALLLGGFRTVFAQLGQRNRADWKARSLLGSLPILAGSLLLATWPVSSLWAIGASLAVVLLMRGWDHLVRALAARHSDRDPMRTEDEATLAA